MGSKKVRGRLPVPSGVKDVTSEGNTYQFVKRIPADIVRLFDRYPELRHGNKHGFVQQSLKTGDYHRCAGARDATAAEWARKWDDMRSYASNNGKPQVLTQITAPIAQELLTKAWVAWVALGYVHRRVPDDFLPWALQVMPAIPPEAEYRFTVEDWEAWDADLEQQRQYRQIESSSIHLVQREIGEVMPRLMPGARLDPDKIEAFTKSTAKPITLDELIKLYEQSPDRTCGNRKGANSNHKPAFTVLRDVLGGNCIVNRLAGCDITKVRKIMAHLPKGAHDRHHLNGERFEVMALEAQEAREDGVDIDGLENSTLAKYFRSINTLFGHAKIYDLISVDLTLPIKVAQTDESEEERAERKAIQPEDLKKFFHSAFRDPEMVNRWHPIVCLYQGTRPNEAAQLDVADIYHNGEVYVININRKGEGKRRKSKISPRIIPIHQQLLDLGFLDFVERRRAAGEKKVFNVRLAGGVGDQTFWESIRDGITQIFRDVGIHQPYVCVPHCMRHTWVAGLRRIHVPEEIRQVLGGWSTGGKSAERRYGDKDEHGRIIHSPAASLKPYLDRLNYDGLWTAPEPKVWVPAAYERVSSNQIKVEQIQQRQAAEGENEVPKEIQKKAAKPKRPVKRVLVPGKLKPPA